MAILIILAKFQNYQQVTTRSCVTNFATNLRSLLASSGKLGTRETVSGAIYFMPRALNLRTPHKERSYYQIIYNLMIKLFKIHITNECKQYIILTTNVFPKRLSIVIYLYFNL